MVRHLTPSEEAVDVDGAVTFKEDELYPVAKRPYGKLKVCSIQCQFEDLSASILVSEYYMLFLMASAALA